MPNALAHEKSPYLLQHADNPVDWLPWGEAAFALSRAQQKPIFLSIGYSTCHWCHVMAHESFEDAGIAAILNEHFVCIKVDREERPDVDRVYMTYVQSLSGHGGWPLSAWLTPELKPFYGGTYFPPDERHGRPGFPSILRAIAAAWGGEREKLVAEADRVLELLQAHHGQGAGGEAASQDSAMALEEAARTALGLGYQHLSRSFDSAHGGFGRAPKFPRGANLDFLFRLAAWQRPPGEVHAEAVRMAAATLRAMARGGIHDHVGGGYHRYAVDEAWFVPHFEKMLYDQAQIAVNCLEARQATGDERFGWMARDIFDYVRRDLTSPEGGFYTAEDADSEIGGTKTGGARAHAEGAFYVWTAAELRAALREDGVAAAAPREQGTDAGPRPSADYEFLAAHFGVEETGNVPAQLDPHGEFSGKNILVARRSLIDSARQLGLEPEMANERLLTALGRLRAERARRPRPLRDDKILTANNGLMISALARGAQVLAGGAASGEGPTADDLLPTALRAAEFVRRELFDPSRGVLFRAWRDGRGANEGFAEDYSYFIQGLLDLYEASFELRWLEWAERLQDKMDELFWDTSSPAEGRGGGYFNSAAGDSGIVLRLKEDYDGAEPAPSSVAAMNLLRLGTMLNREDCRSRALACIEAFRGQWVRAPQALPAMMCALEPALEPPRHVVLAGDPAAEDFRGLAAVLHERLGPRRAILAVTGDADRAWWSSRAPWMTGMSARGGRATAYVCEEFACHEPAQTPAALRALLA